MWCVPLIIKIKIVLDAVLDVINKGDYAFVLKVVVRLYENTTGISAYNRAKEILAKQYGYRY